MTLDDINFMLAYTVSLSMGENINVVHLLCGMEYTAHVYNEKGVRLKAHTLFIELVSHTAL